LIKKFLNIVYRGRHMNATKGGNKASSASSASKSPATAPKTAATTKNAAHPRNAAGQFVAKTTKNPK
jgi:hypothetical protein